MHWVKPRSFRHVFWLVPAALIGCGDPSPPGPPPAVSQPSAAPAAEPPGQSPKTATPSGVDSTDHGQADVIAPAPTVVIARPAAPASSDKLAVPEIPPYEFRESDDPAGAGKFFMGREIAHFMTFHAADWLVRPERQAEEDTAKLLNLLDLREGDVVADIGAGVGYLSFPVAQRVGPKGKVLATEIQPEMLAKLAENQKQRGIENVVGVLSSETDPKLPDAAVDLVLMVDVYHEFTYPVEMMAAIRRSLKPEGRVVFVEFRAEDPAVPIKALHKMSERQVRSEAEALGLRWQETIGVLPWQHVIVFRKRAP